MSQRASITARNCVRQGIGKSTKKDVTYGSIVMSLMLCNGGSTSTSKYPAKSILTQTEILILITYGTELKRKVALISQRIS